jgi:hypothetical protein
MTETAKGFAFIVFVLIVIGLFIFSVFLAISGIRRRNEKPSKKDVLSGKSSKDHG